MPRGLLIAVAHEAIDLPCQIGQHAAALSRMVLWRLVLSAVIAGILTPTLSIIVALALMGASSSNPAGLLGRILGSPVLLGIVLVGVDYLLVRGRLARAISILIWAGKRDAAQLRATTGLRARPTGPPRRLGSRHTPRPCRRTRRSPLLASTSTCWSGTSRAPA